MAFQVRPAAVEELASGDPQAVAGENARRKLQAVDGDPALAVDTLVALDGQIYGKPGDAGAARASLRALGGRTHAVVSGLALRRAGRDEHVVATTQVTFRALDETWVEWYVGTGEWRERAGGYAIQGRGAMLVERIDGDLLNVVGLPVAALLDLWPDLPFGAR